MHHRLRTSLFSIVALTLVIATACGGGDGEESGSDGETATATSTATAASGGEVTPTTTADATQAATSTGGGTLDVFALNVGECFDDPPNIGAGTQVQELEGIPCEQPHDNEVYALIDYPGGSSEPYPGDEAINSFMEEECLAAFEDYVGGEYATSNLDFGNLTPTSGSWEQGDREIVCFLYDSDLAKLEGSAEGSGGQFGPNAGTGGGTSASLGQFDVFNTSVGECFDDSGDVVDCAEPHDNEVYAIFSHEGGASDPYPGDDVMEPFAEDGCTAEFETYVGLDHESSRYQGHFARPSADTWAEGDREVVCFLYDANLQKLTGSAQGTAE